MVNRRPADTALCAVTWPASVRDLCEVGSEVDSVGRDQAIGLVRREVTGRGGLVVALEVANRCAGPSPEDAVHRPFVISQAT